MPFQKREIQAASDPAVEEDWTARQLEARRLSHPLLYIRRVLKLQETIYLILCQCRISILVVTWSESKEMSYLSFVMSRGHAVSTSSRIHDLRLHLVGSWRARLWNKFRRYNSLARRYTNDWIPKIKTKLLVQHYTCRMHHFVYEYHSREREPCWHAVESSNKRIDLQLNVDVIVPTESGSLKYKSGRTPAGKITCQSWLFEIGTTWCLPALRALDNHIELSVEIENVKYSHFRSTTTGPEALLVRKVKPQTPPVCSKFLQRGLFGESWANWTCRRKVGKPRYSWLKEIYFSMRLS